MCTHRNIHPALKQYFLIVYHNFVVFRITIIFVDKDGEEIPVKVPIGMSVLEAAHENDIDLEGADFSSIFFSFSNASSHSLDGI